jgi:hypothetical protein
VVAVLQGHLSKNIRQTTRISRKTGPGRAIGDQEGHDAAGNTPFIWYGKQDVFVSGGRAPHPKMRQNQPPEPLIGRLFRAFLEASNLDGYGLSPYTSAVPANGRDFGPPRGA